MPLSNIFNTKERCKEHECSADRKNIKKIFKPDEGFLDLRLKNRLFPDSYKICDCIIVCNNDDIIIIEILCGVLTYRELQEKSEQLKSCYRVVKDYGLENKIKKIILYYKSLENPKKNPQLRKKLATSRVCNKSIEYIEHKGKSITVGC